MAGEAARDPQAGTGMPVRATRRQGEGARPRERRADPAEILAVIPALNEARHIETCIRTLMGGDPEMREITLVVADGGSTDGTQAIVDGLRGEFPNLVLIDNPGRLQAAALNRAVRDVARPAHRILVRCDAHSIYPPGFVRGVAGALLARGAQSVTVPMDAEGRTPFGRAVAWITDTKLGSGGSAHRGGARSGWVDHGHHAGFSLGWYRRLGGYDETFSHNEDAEYDRRLTEADGRIWLDALWRIGIVARGSAGALARQYWKYGSGRARTILKHRMRPRLRQMVPVGHALALGGSLLLVPFNPLGALYPFVYGVLLLGVSAWSSVRIGSDGLHAGPALGIIHTAWGAGFIVQTLRGAGRVSDTPAIPAPEAEAADTRALPEAAPDEEAERGEAHADAGGADPASEVRSSAGSEPAEETDAACAPEDTPDPSDSLPEDDTGRTEGDGSEGASSDTSGATPEPEAKESAEAGSRDDTRSKPGSKTRPAPEASGTDGEPGDKADSDDDAVLEAGDAAEAALGRLPPARSAGE